jgi:hypothetical protein
MATGRYYRPAQMREVFGLRHKVPSTLRQGFGQDLVIRVLLGVAALALIGGSVWLFETERETSVTTEQTLPTPTATGPPAAAAATPPATQTPLQIGTSPSAPAIFTTSKVTTTRTVGSDTLVLGLLGLAGLCGLLAGFFNRIRESASPAGT